MASAKVKIIESTPKREEAVGEWALLFQYCHYVYSDGPVHKGYRFIWQRPDGRLQPARGQARIPSINDMKCLVDKAIEEGWGNYTEESVSKK